MDSGHHELYYPGCGHPGFSGNNVNHRPFDQYPTEPMHHTTHLDPVIMPRTQHAAVWDVRGGLPRIPVTSTNPTSLHVSEGGYLFICAQPVGSYTVQPQPEVSPAAVSSVVLS